jgi:hypothetical protein
MLPNAGLITDIAHHALEATIYLQPTDVGLSIDELVTVCLAVQTDLFDKEVRTGIDTAYRAGNMEQCKRGLRLKARYDLGDDYLWEREPEYRNFAAIDHVFDSIRLRARQEGRDDVGVLAETILATGEGQGLTRHDLHVAIEWLRVMKTVQIAPDGLVTFCRGSIHTQPRAYGGERRAARQKIPRKPTFVATYAAVKDTLARRTDGRPPAAEPLQAFGLLIGKLGHPSLATWWTQAVAELKASSVLPAAHGVLSWALCEAALIITLDAAERGGLSTGFTGERRRWAADRLVAAKVVDDRLLPVPVAEAALRLNGIRQRIHVGRILDDPGKYSHSDTRPEEVREAIATVDKTVRAVLDWIERHPQVAGRTG